MAEVHFTALLRDLVPEGSLSAPGGTVREALARVFADRPALHSYILDEQGRLRKHVCVFADGRRLAHDRALDHMIQPASRLYVMQALSGG
jgi:molybdopterin synthase sulfur carrier subunit